MNRTAHVISFILFGLLILSCKDVFYPDDIISTEKIPVIQGIIQQGKQPEVKLSWATNYEEQQIEFINDAAVWITDDGGNLEMCVLSSPGIYTPVNNSFTGVLGRSYTLHVETPDGVIYESTPEKINGPPLLDSLYAKPVERTLYSLNAFGGLIGIDYEGLDIMVSLSKNTDSICFFRFRTDVVEQVTYALNPNSLLPTDVFEWYSRILDNAYSVRFSYPGDLKQSVPEHNAGFLEFVYNSSLSSDAQSAPYTEGWIISMHVYSITADVYHYYNSLAQQLGASNRLFAPVPSQVKGNIYCVTDEYAKVTGVFEASSEAVFYKAFAWKDVENYKSRDLVSFPANLGNGSQYDIPPDFWIIF